MNHILTGVLLTEIDPNPDEVSAWQWKTPEEITEELLQEDHRFAPWFPLAWERLTQQE